MERETVLVATLVAYMLAMLAIGWVAERRSRAESDFLLGGRKLGPLVAAISASASSSSVWTLLGVSGHAYALGMSALWLFPACVGGFLLNWYLVAPRLRRLSGADGSLTVTELLAGPHRGPRFRAARVLASAVVLFSLTAYVAAQFQGAGKSFVANFGGMSLAGSVLLGSAIVVAYTVLGGFWAVSLTDVVQGLLMALTAVALPLVALVAVGGFDALADGIARVDAESPGFAALSGGTHGTTAVLSALTVLGITLGYPGQPHVVNRFMALRSEPAVRQARAIAIVWAVVVYAGMILLGLCARVLPGLDVEDREAALFAVLGELFPPVLGGIGLAAVLSAIMSTADSQLLVASSAVSHDLGWHTRRAVLQTRLVVIAVSAVAVLVALSFDEHIFRSVLFAWTALGAAFGPLLLVTLWRGPVGPVQTFLAITIGFGSAVLAHNLRVDRFVQQVVPYLLAFATLALPRERAAGGRSVGEAHR